MPEMVTLEPDPTYKPGDTRDKAVFEKVKSMGEIQIDLTGAAENIRNSGGMYRIKAAPTAPVEVKAMSYDTMSSEEIQLMALSLGMKVTAEKAVKRSEMIAFVKAKLAAVTVTDD